MIEKSKQLDVLKYFVHIRNFIIPFILMLMLFPNVLNAQQLKVKSKNNNDTGEVNINLQLSDFTSDDEETREAADSVLTVIDGEENLVKFNKTWKIKTGDDSTWAAIEYDDSGWKEYPRSQ